MKQLVSTLFIFVALFSLRFIKFSDFIPDPSIQLLLSFCTVLAGSFLVFYLSHSIKIPTFIIALLTGITTSSLLVPLTSNLHFLTAIIGVSATLILFSGGLEMPYERFKKIFPIVLLLSTVGVFCSMLFFGLSLNALTPLFPSAGITVPIAFLLGSILASTDPTVLIPLLKQLRFRSAKMKDIIIGESAITDVTGALLMIILLQMILTTESTFTPLTLISSFFSLKTFSQLIEHSFIGIIFGFFGAGLLIWLSNIKMINRKEYEVDAAFFIFVPLVMYTLAILSGGSGLLAAFIAGLLFQTTDFLYDTERFFNQIVDGFIKPSVFILLGAIVPLNVLIQLAPIGIFISLIFILLIRPLSVVFSLLPLSVTKHKLKPAEILALMSVRETGAVPAVLIMSIIGMDHIGNEAFLAIGLWVIISSILIPPLIKPWLFAKLTIAEKIPDHQGIQICDQTEPFVILASRGGSYDRRLPNVTKWASDHHIHRICLLLCLEDRYSDNALQEQKQKSTKLFKELRQQEETSGKKVDFFLITTEGFLHDAIKSIPSDTCHAVAVFVGKKMLDFRPQEIQELGIPLYFID